MTKSHFSAITLFCKQKSDQWSDLFPVRNKRSFMKQFGRAIVKLRYIILAVAIALLIPAAIGYMHTKINYDMLVYLPQDIDTMKGQDILKDEFGTGAFASYIVKGMSEKQVSDLKAEIEKVPHVKKVLWYDSVMDLSVPMQMLPDDIYEAFNSGDSTMMFIIFDQTTSEDGTVEMFSRGYDGNARRYREPFR